jgi:hypothetical protein
VRLLSRAGRDVMHGPKPINQKPLAGEALEPAEDAMAAIRRAEAAAAARLVAEQADQAGLEAARRQAGNLLAQASRRASELAGQRRRAARAAVEAQAGQEHAVTTAEIARLPPTAEQRRELAVQLAVTLVLTGEAAECSSR